jgi:hypothetical protein
MMCRMDGRYSQIKFSWGSVLALQEVRLNGTISLFIQEPFCALDIKSATISGASVMAFGHQFCTRLFVVCSSLHNTSPPVGLTNALLSKMCTIHPTERLHLPEILSNIVAQRIETSSTTNSSSPLPFVYSSLRRVVDFSRRGS